MAEIYPWQQPLWQQLAGRSQHAHAYLLHGPSGIGKRALAERLMAYLLCQSPSGLDACGNCKSCHLLAAGTHPDNFVLEPEEADKPIKVDQVRELVDFVVQTAQLGGRKVVLLEPAEAMNLNAANALLKSLEEPPANTLFFLMAHSPGRLLPTIRSRCRILRLRALDDADLTRALNAIGAELPEDEARRRLLLDQAGGSVRDALMLTRFSGLDIVSELQKLVDAPRFDAAAAYRVVEGVAARDDGARFAVFNDAVLGRISELARQAAAQGRLRQAADLSSFWQEATERIGATRVYNLDKRQHVVGLLRQLHEMAH